MADVIAMARDAIGITGISREDNGEKIPIPSKLKQINIEDGTFAKEGVSYLSLVRGDYYFAAAFLLR